MAEQQNDWVIEDSEEEDQLCATELDPAPPAEDGVSSIQAFTSTVAESAQEISRIPSLDCAPPAQHTTPSLAPQAEHSTISEFSTKSGSKPRPRPIFNHTNTNPVASTSTSDPILPYTPAFDHREQTTTVARSDPTGIGSISENTLAPIDFSQDIAERAKMRTRKAAKRSTQYAEDVIDITDDELAITPARKPKERPKPRPVKRAIPSRGHPPLPSDPMTIPVPSSSMSLPPSDPFPESTVINFTPPPGLDEVAAPTSPRENSVLKRKRQRPGRFQSPTDDPTDSRPLSTAPGRASSPLSDPEPPAQAPGITPDIGHGVKSNEKDTDDEYGAGQSTKRHRNTKGTEDSTNASPGRSEIDKSKKKSIVEVVILSPKKKNKRAKASGDDSKPRKGPKTKNKRPASSDEDDELLLAPQSNSSAAAKSHKGKKRAIKPRSDGSPSTEVESSSKGIAMGEEEHEHQRGAAPMPHTDGDDKTMSRSTELVTPVPLKVDSTTLLAIPLSDPSQENLQPSASVGGKDPPQSSPTRETPNRGKLRYTLGGLGRKTPMQELIRRAASHPHTPFSATSSPVASPLAKTSKSALRRIAPLHTTRRTPPPPPPPPPPPKKSKKMLELEEKWELELEDEVEGWWALTDEERRDWRKAKRDKELGYDD
ncbi:hypothetical protein H4582DRAFT_2075281 [Lactarius indigo]|nr:hypothetical protein H4582DRAFT_2075281 [Lactarius indigo]